MPKRDEELTARAAFLAQQADRLLQLRADRRSNRPDRTGHRQFRARWSGRGSAAEPERPPRALVIDDTTPDVNRDAGSQAVISHIRSLQRLGFAVTFVPANMEGGPDVVALEAWVSHAAARRGAARWRKCCGARPAASP